MQLNIIPLISEDITFNPINKSDYFIHQTIYDHRVKISEDLYHFLQLIDNQKELDFIILEYNKIYNSIITYEFAYDFLYNKLAKFGIIKSHNAEIKPNLKPSYLKLSFIVINEKAVSKLTQYLKVLFLPKVLKNIFILSVLLLAISFYHYSDQIFHASMAKSEWLFFLY